MGTVSKTIASSEACMKFLGNCRHLCIQPRHLVVKWPFDKQLFQVHSFLLQGVCSGSAALSVTRVLFHF